MGAPRPQRLAVRRLLVACAGRDLEPERAALQAAVAAMTAPSWTLLPAAADSHGLTLQVAAALAAHRDDLPAAVATDLRTRALAHTGARLRHRVALARLAPVLERAAGSWALLKGAALADHVYRLPARRSFGDLDVLVAPASVRPVLAALEDDGAVLLSRNWSYLRHRHKAELVLQLRNGTALDVHWGLLASPDRAPGLHFDTGRLLARTRPLDLAGPEPLTVPGLSAADFLVHVATHAVLAGFGPLRFALDIEQLLRHDPPDAAALAASCAESGAGLPLAVAVQRMQAALGPVDGAQATSGVATATTGGGRRSPVWRGLMRAVDRLNPPARSHEPVPLQFVTASTRESTASSLRAAAAHASERAGALGSPRELRRRLREGIQSVTMIEEELRHVDGGEREALLRQLDRA